MGYRLGVDIGGTFTDCVVIDKKGMVYSFKELSTQDDLSIGLFNVIDKTAKYFKKNIKEFLNETDLFFHGTTIATNAILTRAGAKTGLIVTKGFRDALEMRRAHKENIWDLYLSIPPSLVPRFLRIGVSERINYNGEILEPLKKADVYKACNKFKNEKIEAVAVCTLFSYLNDKHEKEIKKIVESEIPNAFISISSEVLPQIREYERMSTTVINSYVGLRLQRYLSELEKKLINKGLLKTFYITASNGGVMTPKTAVKNASATLLSGPAAGGVGAIYFSRLLKLSKTILMDMGGTSFDVTLINKGKATFTTDGQIAGYRIAKPMIDINTIGAGGGSIAEIDKGGMLRVGPKSASSEPGPACYNMGGIEPTVTDANLVLGYLNKEYFLGGEMKVSYKKAYNAIENKIAKPLSISTKEAAYGIFKIINHNMAGATKVVTIERGHDPRECTLVSVGGACSMHACKIAEEIGSAKIIVPVAASVFCAFGMLESDIRLDYVRNFNAYIPGINLKEFNKVIQEIEKKALKSLFDEGVKTKKTSLLRYLDIRYVGQHHEITVEIPDNCILEEKHLKVIIEKFHNLHELLYNHSLPGNSIEILNLKISAIGYVDKINLHKVEMDLTQDPFFAFKNKRKVYFEEYKEFVEVPVYSREKLKPGNYLEGPAIIEERTTTTVVHPNWYACMDGFNNIVMEEKK